MIREAMRSKALVALGRVVLSKRERVMAEQMIDPAELVAEIIDAVAEHRLPIDCRGPFAGLRREGRKRLGELDPLDYKEHSSISLGQVVVRRGGSAAAVRLVFGGSRKASANGWTSLGRRWATSRSTSDCLNPVRRKSTASARQNASNAVKVASTPCRRSGATTRHATVAAAAPY